MPAAGKSEFLQQCGRVEDHFSIHSSFNHLAEGPHSGLILPPFCGAHLDDRYYKGRVWKNLSYVLFAQQRDRHGINQMAVWRLEMLTMLDKYGAMGRQSRAIGQGLEDDFLEVIHDDH